MTNDDGRRRGAQASPAVAPDKAARRSVSDNDRLAIDLIVTGADLQDVADKAGMSRTTLWRRRRDPGFGAALAQRRAELRQTIVDRFWGDLVQDALRVSAESLAEGDPEMARDILRLAARGLTDIKVVDEPK